MIGPPFRSVATLGRLRTHAEPGRRRRAAAGRPLLKSCSGPVSASPRSPWLLLLLADGNGPLRIAAVLAVLAVVLIGLSDRRCAVTPSRCGSSIEDAVAEEIDGAPARRAQGHRDRRPRHPPALGEKLQALQQTARRAAGPARRPAVGGPAARGRGAGAGARLRQRRWRSGRRDLRARRGPTSALAARAPRTTVVLADTRGRRTPADTRGRRTPADTRGRRTPMSGRRPAAGDGGPGPDLRRAGRRPGRRRWRRTAAAGAGSRRRGPAHRDRPGHHPAHGGRRPGRRDIGTGDVYGADKRYRDDSRYRDDDRYGADSRSADCDDGAQGTGSYGAGQYGGAQGGRRGQDEAADYDSTGYGRRARVDDEQPRSWGSHGDGEESFTDRRLRELRGDRPAIERGDPPAYDDQWSSARAGDRGPLSATTTAVGNCAWASDGRASGPTSPAPSTASRTAGPRCAGTMTGPRSAATMTGPRPPR